MPKEKIGSGGFYFPEIYEKNQKQTEIQLEEGHIDYANLTRWTFPDEFLCFVMNSQLFTFMDRTYPNPRSKNEIPIWFLISCQLVMHLHQTGRYHHLRYLLNAGSLLTRFGFNVGSSKIGFNDKHKKTRQTAVDADSVRKFFKDTPPAEIRHWYLEHLQSWFRIQKAFDHHGIFILDQSYLVVPDNESYADAVPMPVDEQGQRYRNFSALTDEQKQALNYHRCYALSTLLNVGVDHELFHVAGYELGPGNEDELRQAEKLLSQFCRKFPGLIKLLIVDRGYLSRAFVHQLKQEYQIDVLLPLRKNMEAYVDSVAIAQKQNSWQLFDAQFDPNGHLLFKKEFTGISSVELWTPLQLQAVVTRETQWDESLKAYLEHYWVLVSTKNDALAQTMANHYALRAKIEERFRQLKRSWYISEFTSPHASLVETHVCFTLLTYCLLQLYLRRQELQEQTHQMVETLRQDERLGKDAVLVYAGHCYGVFDLDDYTLRVARLQETPRQRLITLMQAQKEARLKKEH